MAAENLTRPPSPANVPELAADAAVQRGRFAELPVGGMGSIYVETISVREGEPSLAVDVPTGIEGASTPIGIFDTLASIRHAVAAIGSSIRGALAAADPQELSIELNFGIKGETRLIPVLVNGSSEGSIKVGMKWTRRPDAETNNPGSQETAGDG